MLRGQWFYFLKKCVLKRNREEVKEIKKEELKPTSYSRLVTGFSTFKDIRIVCALTHY